MSKDVKSLPILDKYAIIKKKYEGKRRCRKCY